MPNRTYALLIAACFAVFVVSNVILAERGAPQQTRLLCDYLNRCGGVERAAMR